MGYQNVKDPRSGRDTDVYAIFLDGYEIMVYLHHLMMLILFYHQTWIVGFFYTVSIAFNLAIVVINNNATQAQQYMSTFESCLDQPSFWLSFFLALATMALFFYAYERASTLTGWRKRVIY